MTKTRQWLEIWGGIITGPRLSAVAAFLAPLITIVSPPAFMAYLAIMAAGLAVPLWLAIYEPESRFSAAQLPDRHQVVFWLKWIVAIAVLFLIGNINAADHMDAIVRTLHVFAAFGTIAVFAAGIKVVDRDSHAIIFRALLWGVIVAGIILTLIGLMHPFRIPFWQETRLVLVPLAPFYNRALVVLVFLGAIAIASALTKGRRNLSFVAAGLIIAAAFLSSSESAKIALFTFAAVSFLVWRWENRAIFCLGALSLIWVWLLPWGTGALHNLASSNSWIVENWTAYGPVRTSLSRLEIWAASSDQILKNPVFGWGLDGVEHYGLPTLKHVFFASEYVHHPHNGALHAWIDFGILGPVVFTLAIIGICRALLKTNMQCRPFLASLTFGATIIIFVSHGLWETWWMGLLGYVFGIAPLVGDKDDFGPRSAGPN